VIVGDHTTQACFVMFDRDVEKIVGIKASQLAQKIVEVRFVLIHCYCSKSDATVDRY
jgi:hypothetical protein